MRHCCLNLLLRVRDMTNFLFRYKLSDKDRSFINSNSHSKLLGHHLIARSSTLRLMFGFFAY